ncbi:MAG: tetratricopeptide repeat protein [Erythrobacter sp.]
MQPEAATGVSLSARVFGAFQCNTASGLTVLATNRRANLVLAILILQPEHRIDRETLARMLWPDRFLPQAKASLRQCLHDLGRHLGDRSYCGLFVSRSEVSIDPDSVTCDLFDLEDHLSRDNAAAAIEDLLAIGNRRILQSTSLNPVFDEWLCARRDHIDARIKAAIADAIRRAPDAEGDRLLAAARARYPAYQAAVTEIGLVPIAVLPFSQTDEIGGSFFLGEGITDELTAQLGGLGGIALAGRTSIAAVIAKGRTLQQIASELSVKHLVEGHVKRTAATIEVHIALIDGQTGMQLWSDRITGSIEDFFESRSVIGANVIASICKTLSLSPSPGPVRKMTSDREAYSLYLQGRSLIQRSLQEGAVTKAIELLEECLAIDPDFAEAWAALADAHVHTAVYTPCLDRIERSQKAAECASRAVALDPGQGQALAIQGIHEWTRKNPAGALDLAFEAYAREPQSADVALRLGSFLLYIGRTRDALPFIEAATHHDPVYGRNYALLAAAHFNLGNIDEAEAAATRMRDLGMPGMWLAVVQAARGNHDEAVETYYQSRTLMNTVILPPAGMEPMSDDARDAYWRIAADGVCSGRPQAQAVYREMLNGLHATMPDPYDPTIAFPALWLGHSRLVMKIFRERIHPANMFALMTLWSDTDPIRQTREHPEFMAFATEIGLVEAWKRYGWPDRMQDMSTNI